jgi:GWxTD domain-containing protein
LEIEAEGGVTTRGMDLTGLPPGDYRLAVAAVFPDTTVELAAPFTMASFETETALAQTVQSRTLDEFAHLTEAQLDSLYEPLVYVFEDSERGLYEGLSIEGKRNYLRRFWAKRDPTPGTAFNEAQRDYYGRIEEANRRFREGGAGDVPGWRTDRGRIFIRYGAPDDWFNQPEPVGTYAYELWKYTSGRARKFVFIDETGFGNYVLLFTDERREPSRSGGLDLLDPEDVRRINAF